MSNKDLIAYLKRMFPEEYKQDETPLISKYADIIEAYNDAIDIGQHQFAYHIIEMLEALDFEESKKTAVDPYRKGKIKDLAKQIILARIQIGSSLPVHEENLEPSIEAAKLIIDTLDKKVK